MAAGSEPSATTRPAVASSDTARTLETGGPLRLAAAAFALTWQSASGRLLANTLLTVSQSALPVLAAWATKLIIDRLTGGAPWAELVGITAALIILGVLAVAVPHASSYLRAEIGRRVGLLAQDRLYTKVNTFPGLARFESPTFLDRLRMARQSGATSPGQISEAGLQVLAAAVTVGGFLGSLLLLSPLMTLLVALAAVPALVAEIHLARVRARMMWNVSPKVRREMFYGSLMGDVEPAKEVRLFGIGDFLRRRMLRERRAANDAERGVDRRQLSVQASLGLLSAAVAGTGLLWAVWAARQGQISLGDVTMFIAAVAGVQAGLASLVGEIGSTHNQLLLFRHYIGVLEAPSDLPVASRPARIARLRRGIEFRDVWFRYDRDHPWVLQGVDLTIPYGAAVGLVGRNGAGKSTLVKLLCRYYDPTKGSITWDGVDLRDVAPEELRARIGAVFQDYMSYDLSAAENIAVGDLACLGDPGQLERVARLAGVHDKLASLPLGYRTLLTRVFFSGDTDGEGPVGVMLSGGQWQRVALARSLLRLDRDVLILDEPSSGLDAEAEYRIHQMLREQRRGRTSLLISHRLGTVRDADMLAVLDGGTVVEQGTHGELVDQGGIYSELFAMQASGYTHEAVSG